MTRSPLHQSLHPLGKGPVDALCPHIALVTDTPFPAASSGSSAMVGQHAVSLIEAGYRVSVLAARRGGSEPAAERLPDGVTVHRYPRPDRGRGLVELARFILAVRRGFSSILRRDPVQAAVVEQPLGGFALATLPSSYRIPSVYSYYSSWYEEYLVRNQVQHALDPRRCAAHVRKLMERAAMRRSRCVIALSQYSLGNLQSLHSLGRTPLRYIPGGVDVDRFRVVEDRARTRTLLGLPAEGPLFLTVRNLEPRMGIDRLLAAAHLLKRRWHNWLLVIGGSGPLRESLERQSAELCLGDHVKFLGYVPDELLADYYGCCDAFVLPTREMEGFGLVTVEALACGTPVLGTPVGATVEILSRLSPRLVFADSSSQAMADGMLEFIASRERFPTSQACRSYAAEYYSRRTVGRRYVQLVEHVCELPRTSEIQG